MFLGIAVLALTQAASTPEDAIAVLEDGLTKLDAAYTALSELVITGVDERARIPRTGILMDPADEAGTDGRYVFSVGAVMKGSPAFRAGVLQGDRIIGVSGRTLDHEPPEIGRFLLEQDRPERAVDLQLMRDGTEVNVTLTREPVACVIEAAGDLNRGTWQTRLGNVRTMHDTLRAALRDDGVSVLHRAMFGRYRLMELYAEFDVIASALGDDIAEARQIRCSPLP